MLSHIDLVPSDPDWDVTALYEAQISGLEGCRSDSAKIFQKWFLDRSEDGRCLSRAQVRPADMKDFLSHISLVELIGDPPRDVFIRVHGGHPSAIYGELTNKSASEKVPPIVFQRWLKALSAVHMIQNPMCFVAPIILTDASIFISEHILVPVRSADSAALFLGFHEIWPDDGEAVTWPRLKNSHALHGQIRPDGVVKAAG